MNFFSEFIRSEATWWDRLICRVFGCVLYSEIEAQWYPVDTQEDRERRERMRFCVRCGRYPRQ